MPHLLGCGVSLRTLLWRSKRGRSSEVVYLDKKSGPPGGRDRFFKGLTACDLGSLTSASGSEASGAEGEEGEGGGLGDCGLYCIPEVFYGHRTAAIFVDT